MFSRSTNLYVSLFSFSAALLIASPGYAQVAAPPAPDATAAATSTPASAEMRLQSLVDGLIKDSQLSATVCVYVEDAASGKVLANVNGTKPMIPASNNKIVTTAAALSLLGPDYKFVTRFFGTGPVENGTLKGDLVVYGTGDPGISGRFQQDKADITAVMRHWGDQLKALGINHITGNIVADDSYYEDLYFHPNWYGKERAEYYSAEISALSFNDNCVDINWSGKDKLPDTTATYTLNPVSDFYTFESEVKVAAKGRSTERYYAREATDNKLRATGTINVDATALDSMAIHDGALYTVTILKDVLKKQGIAVDGNPLKTRGAATASNAKTLFDYQGTTMQQTCEIINLNSQNYFAECAIKTLGKEKAGEGTWKAGARIVMDFCKKNGIFSEGHHAEDGSGLAGENNVTGRQLVDLLRFMDKTQKDNWRKTLPQGNVRGSLKRRFIGTTEGKEVAERIYGKTGSIGGVRSLSGFVVDANGQELYYSIILNQLGRGDTSKGMTLIDNVAIKLAKSGR